MNLMHGMLGLPLLWGALVGALLLNNRGDDKEANRNAEHHTGHEGKHDEHLRHGVGLLRGEHSQQRARSRGPGVTGRPYGWG